MNYVKEQVGLFYNAFKKTLRGTPRLGLDPSPRALSHNMELFGVPKPTGTQAHHIVGGATEVGKDLQRRLREGASEQARAFSVCCRDSTQFSKFRRLSGAIFARSSAHSPAYLNCGRNAPVFGINCLRTAYRFASANSVTIWAVFFARPLKRVLA